MKLARKFDIYTIIISTLSIAALMVFTNFTHSLSFDRPFLIILAIGVVMFFALVVSKIILSRIIIRPLKTIEGVSEAITGGETGKRIDIRSGDELDSLSKSVNKMAEAIEEKIKQLTDSIAKEQEVVREQAILNELMGFIASGMDIQQILRTFINRTRDLMKAEHSGIFILERQEAESEPELKIFLNTFEEETSMDCAKTMLNGIFSNSIRTFMPYRANTLSGEIPGPHFIVRNMLSIPLSSADKKVVGLILLANKDGGFTEKDEDVLFGFTFQAFQAITMQKEIIRYATTDGLTSLNNYRVFVKRLDEEMERAVRYSRDLSVLMVDIDRFKSLNDIYGHQSGDKVLKTIAALILKNIRNTDFAARYGGEEFALILPETTGPQAFTVAERLRNSINRHDFLLRDKELTNVSVSIGYATYPDDADGSEMLLKKADQGLYFAKENGRNMSCRFYDIRGKVEDNMPEELKSILRDTSLTSIKELAKAIDSKSNYMKGHSFEVAALSVKIGKELKLDESQVEGLRIASLLHDIGNLAIPDNILNKPGTLTEEEKKIIKGHPGLSEMLLKHYPKSDYVLPAILYHHERYDGKGYPRGLQADEIPLPAKILGAVEAYHAMTSSRPYKKRKTRIEAIAELEREAGRQFDPEVVRLLVDFLKNFPDPAEKRNSG
jgi:diguanylate cyclase (GGDEF)-like protein